jgi:hypothetical protein
MSPRLPAVKSREVIRALERGDLPYRGLQAAIAA